MAAAESDPGAQVLKELFRRFRPVHSGNDDVNGGDLVSDFGEWLQEVQEKMPAITGKPFVAKVARHPDRSKYWSEAGGWGDLENATAYFVIAPAGLKRVSREWRDIELAVELEAEAESDGDAERPRA